VPSDSLQNRQVVYMRTGEEHVSGGGPVSIAERHVALDYSGIIRDRAVTRPDRFSNRGQVVGDREFE
jgi:hypothetical protein